MKLKLFYLIIICLFSTKVTFSQCDTDRYIEGIFPTITEHNAIKFGENTTLPNNNLRELKMDIFEPDGDTLAERPVLIMAFGGSFITGDRTQMASYCRSFASKGYVTAAIDYRILDGLVVPDSILMTKIVFGAVSDMKASIRFLRKEAQVNGNPYRIDTNKIFVGGISAGAITAAHAAYLDNLMEADSFVLDIINNNGGLEGNTDDPNNPNMAYSSKVQGVVNLSGGLREANYIDADDPPLVSAHGDSDGTVPYGDGYAEIFGIPIAKLQGSSLLHPQALSVGLRSELYTVAGGGHTDFYSDAVHSANIDSIVAHFLKEIVCGISVNTKNIDSDIEDITIYPNPSSGEMFVDFTNLKTIQQIIISSSLGQTIAVYQQPKERQLRLDKKHFGNGLFILSIKTKKGYITKKLIFQ